MKKILSALILVSAFFTANLSAQVVKQPLPDGRVEVFDGFEKGNYWIWGGSDWDKYGSHKYSSGANISKVWASEGKHSLECTMEEMPGNLGWYSAVWFYDGTNDLSGTKYIAIDLYNPTDYVFQIALVLQSTNDWKWQQAETYTLGKGEHTLVFDVQQFSADLNDVRRINLSHGSWVSTNNEVEFYVDNIRLIK